MQPLRLILCITLLGLALSNASAQTNEVALAPDTLQVQVQEEGNAQPVEQAVKLEQKKKPYDLDSKKALLFSIVPGGGQIYNRMYWKLPIIIGAYTACYYAISWNNNNLQDYTIAYRDIKSDTPLSNTSWQDFLPYGANPESYVNNISFHNQLKRGRDYFRRYRDMSIIITAAVYVLVMIDAYVDAELYSFDISPNVTLSCAPTYISPQNVVTPRTTGAYGLHLALSF